MSIDVPTISLPLHIHDFNEIVIYGGVYNEAKNEYKKWAQLNRIKVDTGL